MIKPTKRKYNAVNTNQQRLVTQVVQLLSGCASEVEKIKWLWIKDKIWIFLCLWWLWVCVCKREKERESQFIHKSETVWAVNTLGNSAFFSSLFLNCVYVCLTVLVCKREKERNCECGCLLCFVCRVCMWESVCMLWQRGCVLRGSKQVFSKWGGD